MCQPHEEVYNWLIFRRTVREIQWVEPRISHSLLNQYPDVYWRTVFTLFDTPLKTGTWSQGVNTVASFLDCHGFVTEPYHQEPDSTGQYYFRNRDRPRIRHKWTLFNGLPQVGLTTRPNSILIPRWLYTSLFEQFTLNAELSPDGQTVKLSSLNLVVLLTEQITNFDRTTMGVHQGGRRVLSLTIPLVRVLYYITLYDSFRYEVESMRASVCTLYIRALNGGFEVSSVLTVVEQCVNQIRRILLNDAILRTRILVRFFRLMTQNDLFVRTYQDAQLRAGMYDYLLNVGAHYPGWPNQFTERELACWDSGADHTAVNPFEGYSEVADFLARAAFMPSSGTVTNSELASLLIESMVEHAQEPGLSESRSYGQDLNRVSHLVELATGETVLQARFQLLDPMQIRSSILWVCLFEYLCEPTQTDFDFYEFEVTRE